MTEEFTINAGEDEILVEFAPLQRPGVRQVSSFSVRPEDMAGKSARALDKAMSTIKQMGNRVTKAIKSIDAVDRPNKVELEFGLSLDADLGAYVAKVSTEAGFKVVLTWEQSEKME
jgi:hypothetical protein